MPTISFNSSSSNSTSISISISTSVSIYAISSEKLSYSIHDYPSFSRLQLSHSFGHSHAITCHRSPNTHRHTKLNSFSGSTSEPLFPHSTLDFHFDSSTFSFLLSAISFRRPLLPLHLSLSSALLSQKTKPTTTHTPSNSP